MNIPKQLFQVRLTTLLFLMLVSTLVVIVYTKEMRIRKLEQRVEMFEEHLPEYRIAKQVKSLEAQLAESIRLYGPDHPIVRDLELQITLKQREKKTESLRASFNKNSGGTK